MGRDAPPPRGVRLPLPGPAAAGPAGAAELRRRRRSARYVGPVTSAGRYLEAPRGPVQGGSVCLGLKANQRRARHCQRDL